MDKQNTLQRARFSPELVAKLKTMPPKEAVESYPVKEWDPETRTSKARNVYFVNGDESLLALNELFGPDGWSFVIEETSVESGEPRPNRKGELVDRTVYKVQGMLSIYVDGILAVEKPGSGTCERVGNRSEEIEKAYKGAETDAIKRAARLLGRYFGLGLTREIERLQREQARSASAQATASPPAHLNGAAEARAVPSSEDAPVNGHVDTTVEEPMEETAWNAGPAAAQPASAPEATPAATPASPPVDAPEFEHVGAFMGWASATHGISSPDDVLSIARGNVPEAAEAEKVADLLPYINDPRLIGAISRAA